MDENLTRSDEVAAEVTSDGTMPVIASYNVRVTYRGTVNIVPPTNEAVEEAVENVLSDLGGVGAVAVRAKSERLDR